MVDLLPAVQMCSIKDLEHHVTICPMYIPTIWRVPLLLLPPSQLHGIVYCIAEGGPEPDWVMQPTSFVAIAHADASPPSTFLTRIQVESTTLCSCAAQPG
jgi:hypothetical protein